MKKILGVILSLFITSSAYADTCAKALTNVFTSYQAAKLCATFVGTATISGALTFTATGPIVAPTALAFAIANATTPNYTINGGVNVTGPSAFVLAASTSLAVSAGAATTPNYTFDSVKLAGPSSFVLAASTAIPIAPGSANTPIGQFQTNGLSFSKALAQPIFPAAAVITPFVTYAAGSAQLTQVENIIAAGAPTSAFVELPAATSYVGQTLKVYNQGSNPVAIVPASGAINLAAALTPYACSTLNKCECEGLTTGGWGCIKTAW